MSAIGMTGAELRVVFGKNIMDLTDEELDRAIDLCRGKGIEILSIASPLLKCVLPNAPDVDSRFQQDIFGSKHTFADQPRLTDRAFAIAHKTGAKIIRGVKLCRVKADRPVRWRIAPSRRRIKATSVVSATPNTLAAKVM